MSSGLQDGNVKGTYIFGPTLTPVAVAANTAVEQTFSVPGLNVGDCVDISSPGVTAGVALLGGRVSAKDTLALTFGNYTAGSLTPLAGVHTLQITRPEVPGLKVTFPA